MIIDIHSHILPKVDDGSESMDMSLEMAKIYLNNGINKVIATPHYVKDSSMNSSYNKNMEIFNEFKKKLKQENINLDIFLGNEVYMHDDILSDINNNIITSLNNSRYILIELPMVDVTNNCKKNLEDLIKAGYIPVIAHPERNLEVIKDPNIIYNLIKMGCLIQINLPSLEGRYGRDIFNVSKILLKNNMVHLIGSNAHSNYRQSPNVSRGLTNLLDIVGRDRFNKLSCENPGRILNNLDINIEEPVKYKRKFRIKDLFKFKD